VELHLERLRLRTMLLWLFEVAIETYGLMKIASTERVLPDAVMP
jgi:putative transposase